MYECRVHYFIKSSRFFSLGPKIKLPKNWHRVYAKNVDTIRNASHLNLCCVNFIKLKSVRRFAIGKQLKKNVEKKNILVMCLEYLCACILSFSSLSSPSSSSNFFIHPKHIYNTKIPCWAIGHFYLARIFFSLRSPK